MLVLTVPCLLQDDLLLRCQNNAIGPSAGSPNSAYVHFDSFCVHYDAGGISSQPHIIMFVTIATHSTVATSCRLMSSSPVLRGQALAASQHAHRPPHCCLVLFL